MRYSGPTIKRQTDNALTSMENHLESGYCYNNNHNT